MCKGEGSQVRPETDARSLGNVADAKMQGTVRQGTRIDGLYQHFRNRLIYRVACVSVLDGLNTRIVTYQGIDDGRFWSRGEEAFHEYVHGQQRFTYIGQSLPNR